MGDDIKKIPTDLAQCENYSETVSTLDELFDTNNDNELDNATENKMPKIHTYKPKRKCKNIKSVLLNQMNRLKPAIIATILMVILNLKIVDNAVQKIGLDYITVLIIKTILFFLITCISIFI